MSIATLAFFSRPTGTLHSHVVRPAAHPWERGRVVTVWKVPQTTVSYVRGQRGDLHPVETVEMKDIQNTYEYDTEDQLAKIMKFLEQMEQP